MGFSSALTVSMGCSSALTVSMGCSSALTVSMGFSSALTVSMGCSSALTVSMGCSSVLSGFMSDWSGVSTATGKSDISDDSFILGISDGICKSGVSSILIVSFGIDSSGYPVESDVCGGSDISGDISVLSVFFSAFVSSVFIELSLDTAYNFLSFSSTSCIDMLSLFACSNIALVSLNLEDVLLTNFFLTIAS